MKECSGCNGTGCWMCHEPNDFFTEENVNKTRMNIDEPFKEMEKIKLYERLLSKLNNPPTTKKWFEMELKWNDGYEAEIIFDDKIDLKLHRMLIEHFNFLISECEKNIGRMMRNSK